jgi:hypothetical protein
MDGIGLWALGFAGALRGHWWACMIDSVTIKADRSWSIPI